MLGAAAMLEAKPGHELARTILQRFPDVHLDLLAETRRPEWQWFEIVLAYDNARLPEALIRAGMALDRDDLVQCGLSTWNGSSPSRPRRGTVPRAWARKASIAPMPIHSSSTSSRWKAQATVEACQAAHAATGDPRWVAEAERAYGCSWG